MFARRSLFLFALLLSLFASVLADSKDQTSTDTTADYAAFQKLLADVDETSIHSALHRWSNKFRDGIFSKDRTAIEAVHSENPPLATKLVHLAKRQSNSTITSSTQTKTSATSAKTTSSMDAAQSSSASSLSKVLSSLSTESGAVVTTTNAQSETLASTIGGDASTLPSGESTFMRVSSTVLSTTTLANGQPSTVTGVTVVNAPATEVATPSGSAGVSPSGGQSGSPSVQSGAASATRGLKNEMFAMLGGAVAVAFALQ